MLISHRALLSGSQVTDVVGLGGSHSEPDRIAVAQGTTLRILDAKKMGFPVVESYPFRSPIQMIAAVPGEAPAVFVLLRTLKWFVFQLPRLVRSGSLYSSIACKPTRSIINRASVLSQRPAASNPTATAAVMFKEQRVAYAVHPEYLAVHVYIDVIHVIPLAEDTETLVIPLLGDVVDMAFMGPTDVSCRLSCISDSKQGGREIHIFGLTSDKASFTKEVSCHLPADAHSILPLQPEREAAVMVFTRDEIIRVTAPLTIPLTVEHLAAFLPKDGVILYQCHFRDNIYLTCDASGGLIGCDFPTRGRPKTEYMKNVGAACGVVRIGENRFVVCAPFGDSVIYELIIHEDGFTVKECGRIPCIGPVLRMEVVGDGIICGTGRGSSGCIRRFEESIGTTLVGEVAVDGCINFFGAMHDTRLYMCLSFYDGTQIVMFDGKKLTRVEYGAVDPEIPTILFQRVESGFIHVAEQTVCRFDPDDYEGKHVKAVKGKRKAGHEQPGALTKTFNDHIVAACVSERHIVIADTQFIVRVLDIENIETSKRWKINTQPLLVAAYDSPSDTYIAVYLVGNTVLMFKLSDLKSRMEVSLPLLTIPVSMVMEPDAMTVLIGTSEGSVLKISDDWSSVSNEKVCHTKIMLHHSDDGAVIGSGTPPFVLGSSRRYVKAIACEDIAKCGDFVCCLQDDQISIFSVDQSSVGLSKVELHVPGLVNFCLGPRPGTFICLTENPSLEQFITRFDSGEETARYEQPHEHRISMFTYVYVEDRPLVVIGDDSPAITILDSTSLTIVGSQKIMGIPTASCYFAPFFVVARVGGIDFYVVKNLDDQYEMDRKVIAGSQAIIPDILVVNGYLIACDQQRGLIVYNVADDAATILSYDNRPKQLNKLAVMRDIVFASSYQSIVYCYQLQDDGSIIEVSSFQSDAAVLSFSSTETRLFYGTTSGGIGEFSFTEKEDLLSLSDAMTSDDRLVLSDRVPPSRCAFQDTARFIDMDDISLLLHADPVVTDRILDRAQLTRDRLAAAIFPDSNLI